MLKEDRRDPEKPRKGMHCIKFWTSYIVGKTSFEMKI